MNLRHHRATKEAAESPLSSKRVSAPGIALECAVRYAEWKLAIYAQHGPVRILFKDGKPVPQEQQNG